MTEKEKAIEDETVELSIEPTEKKKPHRRRTVVITVVALALLAAGGIAWKTHTDRLMAEARADCAAASEHLRIVTNDYNTLLDDQAASMAKPDRKSVKDAKTLDALSKAMKASTPKTVSCKADSRPGVQDAAKAITANASWYKAHTKSLNRLVKAVETSKLDKTVDDADALYKETDGKVADGKTRASLLDAIKKTRRGRHRESRERGQRIEGGEGAGRRGGEGQGRTGSRRGRRRHAAGAGIAIPNIFRRRIVLEPRLLVFGRILVRFRRFRILTVAIQRRRLVGRFRLRPAHRHRRQRHTRPERA